MNIMNIYGPTEGWQAISEVSCFSVVLSAAEDEVLLTLSKGARWGKDSKLYWE